MAITWSNKAWGRESDLQRLNSQRNNHKLGPKTRLGADRAHTKINQQLRDRKYTSMREQLIKATQAGDQLAVAKIELRIREHLGEDKFAASGHKDY